MNPTSPPSQGGLHELLKTIHESAAAEMHVSDLAPVGIMISTTEEGLRFPLVNVLLCHTVAFTIEADQNGLEEDRTRRERNDK